MTALYPKRLTDIESITNLEFLARQVVEGFIVGMHKSPYHGFSVEFAEHRLYNPGDSVRNIDWKVFARTDKLFVKKFEEETNLRCQIVIDASSSMYYPFEKDQNNKITFSVLCASALILLLKKQRDATGLSVFSDKIDVHTQAKSSAMHIQSLFSHLENILSSKKLNVSTNTSECIHEISETLHKRSLVIIFSDFLSRENSNDVFKALQHLKYNKHEVLLFHVNDKSTEQDFSFENRPYLFVDMETGEKVKLHAHAAKSYYIQKVTQFQKAIKEKAAQYNMDIVQADILQDFRHILTSYLLKRSRLF